MQIKHCLRCEAKAREKRPELSEAEKMALADWVWRGDEKGEERPIRCGKCGSPYWDVAPKKRKKKS